MVQATPCSACWPAANVANVSFWQQLALLAERGNGWAFPPRFFSQKNNSMSKITFTLFMLASKRSCCTTFFMATRLDEPDILGVSVENRRWAVGGIEGWIWMDDAETKVQMITSGFRLFTFSWLQLTSRYTRGRQMKNKTSLKMSLLWSYNHKQSNVNIYFS